MTNEHRNQISQQELLQRAQEVKKSYADGLMTKANVVGVGVGFAHEGHQITEKIAVIVLVSRKVPCSMLSAEDIIPRELDGVPVDVQEVGTLKKM